MQKQLEEQKPEDSKLQITISGWLKRIALAIVFFVVVMQIIGRHFPDLMPSKTDEKIIEKIEPPIENIAEPPKKKIIEEKQDTDIITSDLSDEQPPQSNERIKSLEEKILQIEASHAAAISALEVRITTENSTTQSKTKSIVSALVAFGQLKEAVKNGENYGEQLRSLKELAINKPEAEEIITMLEVHSTSGIKTPAQLKIELAQLIKQIITNKSENIFLQTLHKFITIRKVGEQKGDDDESILARTEAKLARGDLSAALQEIQELSQPAQEILASWVEDGKLWISTQKNIDKLQLLLTRIEPVLKP